MRFIEGRTWSADKVRSMCIKLDRYTCGDNEAYNKMLAFVDNNEPTPENIAIVAEDIRRHSDLTAYGLDPLEELEAIMFDITYDCVRIDYKIDRSGSPFIELIR